MKQLSYWDGKQTLRIDHHGVLMEAVENMRVHDEATSGSVEVLQEVVPGTDKGEKEDGTWAEREN